MKIGDEFGLHCLPVDLFALDAAGGDELILIGGLPLHAVASSQAFRDEFVFGFLGELGPNGLLANAGGLDQTLPQAARQGIDGCVFHGFLAVSLAGSREVFA